MAEYNTSLVRRDPNKDQDYQLAEQQQRAAHYASGKAVAYSNAGLQAQYADRQMSKTLQLQKMGLAKKTQDEQSAMGRERLKMDKDRLRYQKKQDTMTAYLGAANMALGAGLGYMQWQEQKKVKRQQDLMSEFLYTTKKKGQIEDMSDYLKSGYQKFKNR
jgi:hypothetical protein